jgi:hypothetical protein
MINATTGQGTPTLITRAVMLVILCMTLAVWAVIGFIFWIPLLVRVTTVFSAMVIHAAITQQGPGQLRDSLETASGFYPLGFRVAIETLYNPNAGLGSRRASYDLGIGRVLVEVLWTVAFWLFFIFVTKPAILPLRWLHHIHLFSR